MPTAGENPSRRAGGFRAVLCQAPTVFAPIGGITPPLALEGPTGSLRRCPRNATRRISPTPGFSQTATDAISALVAKDRAGTSAHDRTSTSGGFQTGGRARAALDGRFRQLSSAPVSGHGSLSEPAILSGRIGSAGPRGDRSVAGTRS